MCQLILLKIAEIIFSALIFWENSAVEIRYGVFYVYLLLC